MATKPECIILIGLPAAGKSTYFHEKLRDTHVRINGDMLRTKHREHLLLTACLQGGISFVVDKTNVSRKDRARWVIAARDAGFTVRGVILDSDRNTCLERNRMRAGSARVPDVAVRDFSARYERPSLDEGFDSLVLARREGGWVESNL